MKNVDNTYLSLYKSLIIPAEDSSKSAHGFICNIYDRETDSMILFNQERSTLCISYSRTFFCKEVISISKVYSFSYVCRKKELEKIKQHRMTSVKTHRTC